MLTKVQISDPTRVMGRYPHQLSGGMNQRVVIAMALAKDPTLLILDEPTTGLDATVEAEVLDLVAALRQEFGTSVLFISHNLDVILRMCDRSVCCTPGASSRTAPSRRYSTTRAIRTPSGCCVASLAPAPARTRVGSTPSPGSCRASGPSCPGCVFTERCALAEDICHRQEDPPLFDLGGGHASRCHFHERAQELPRDTTPVAVTERADRDCRRGCPSSAPATCARRSTRTVTTCGRSRTSRSPWRPARRSGSSASRAAARRRWPGCCSG